MSKTEILLPVTFSSLEKISDFIQAQAHQSQLSFKKTWEVMLVVDEICCNIVTHGKPIEGKHALWVAWKDDGQVVGVLIMDNGAPYNPLLPCPEEEEILEESKRLGGMGPHLIGEMLDEVSYRRENGCNCVWLYKVKKGGKRKCSFAEAKKIGNGGKKVQGRYFNGRAR
ncbi:MAG: ATP-binding protein [Candidatus Omnitrophica bacterium]|nr:ATP-binding protein [Candidatus Omnitrophota bacterium]